MIGLDRPLKPEWIYKTLQMFEVGEKPTVYNIPFEEIAAELIGKEGKRKVRTVIFRSFLYTMQTEKNKIESNQFMESVKNYSLEEMKPLFLAKLFIDYEIVRNIIRKIFLVMQGDRSFSSNILRKQMVKTYGDRDVVKRSLRAVLSTLENFKYLSKLNNQFRLNDLIILSEYQTRYFINLYGAYYLKSKSVDLDSFDEAFILFFDLSGIYEVAKKYHSHDWEYIRDHGRNLVLLK